MLGDHHAFLHVHCIVYIILNSSHLHRLFNYSEVLLLLDLRIVIFTDVIEYYVSIILEAHPFLILVIAGLAVARGNISSMDVMVVLWLLVSEHDMFAAAGSLVVSCRLHWTYIFLVIR